MHNLSESNFPVFRTNSPIGELLNIWDLPLKESRHPVIQQALLRICIVSDRRGSCLLEPDLPTVYRLPSWWHTSHQSAQEWEQEGLISVQRHNKEYRWNKLTKITEKDTFFVGNFQGERNEDGLNKILNLQREADLLSWSSKVNIYLNSTMNYKGFHWNNIIGSTQNAH